ncbi:MAG TPA: CfrBI family restriction endonuclease [Chthonomonas sp.]|uniref:CfrBI family restriction endonuclease n=1 Tax=Chthonomonas sp. TaxID=2282153 RepID=UPI002B4B0CFE|nr:CfrBI family restriction endonuclease [Chthonomonas sp.]HLI49194.1 CfrBI family restriction endonuclease [Chthonomonas sp.]
MVTTTLLSNIIRKLILGEDYRSEIVALIDAQFLEYAIAFFRKVAEAKMRHLPITLDWYRQEMITADLPKEEIATNAGLNIKTINNMYNTARKEIVLQASLEHYETLHEAIRNLTHDTDVNLMLTIKFNHVAIDLDINESLIVINALAVARAALRGGLWSTAGKQVEKPLMMTLCALHKVPRRHFMVAEPPKHQREADFYLVAPSGKLFRCEVKLMGKGNPESTDAAFARDTDILIADKLSETNKTQLSAHGILWMELRNASDLSQFDDILTHLGIPHQPVTGNIATKLETVIKKVFESSTTQPPNPIRLHEEKEFYSSDYLVEFDDET